MPRVGMPLVLPPRACFAGSLALGAAAGATWQPRPGRTVPSAPCGRRRGRAWELASADRYFQSGCPRGGWVAAGVGRGRRARGPRAARIPWGSCGRPGAPAPARRWAPRLSPAERGRRGSRAAGPGRGRAGSGHRGPGSRAAAAPAGAWRTELRQGATRARGHASRPPETTTPRPLGGRGRPAPLVGPLGGGRGAAVSRATRALGRRAGGGPAPYCVAAGAGPRGAGQVRAGALRGQGRRPAGLGSPGGAEQAGAGAPWDSLGSRTRVLGSEVGFLMGGWWGVPRDPEASGGNACACMRVCVCPRGRASVQGVGPGGFRKGEFRGPEQGIGVGYQRSTVG